MVSEAGRVRADVGPELAPRVRPVQKRARQTVDLILNTAGELLSEVGIDAFTTNLLAERAGVAVRSVYRYYPNKLAVIVALYERHESTWEPFFAAAVKSLSDPNQSAARAWDTLLDEYVIFLEEGSGWAIRRAVQAFPEIRDFDKSDNENRGHRVAAALRDRGASASRQRLEHVGCMLVDTASAIIDDAWCRRGAVSSSVLKELKVMHHTYLSIYVDESK